MLVRSLHMILNESEKIKENIYSPSGLVAGREYAGVRDRVTTGASTAMEATSACTVCCINFSSVEVSGVNAGVAVVVPDTEVN